MRWLLLLSLLVCGCGESTVARHKEVVPFDQVPAAVLKAAQAEQPDVTFDTAWKTESGNYEVRGKAKTGKIHDVQVTEAGKVVEVD